jgi:hypothetical protein
MCHTKLYNSLLVELICLYVLRRADAHDVRTGVDHRVGC